MTKIEWTEATWNPIVGCSIVSPGCTNCYAMRMAARLEAMGGDGLDDNGYAVRGSGPLDHYRGTTKRSKAGPVWTGKVALAPEHALTAPLRRRKSTMYFVNSMSDLFHEDVPDEWIDRVFAVMALSPQHTFQCLTKRSARMRKFCNDPHTPHRIAKAMDTLTSAPVAEERVAVIDGFPGYFVTDRGRVLSDRGSAQCVHCGQPVERTARARYCSKRCRHNAQYRLRTGKPMLFPASLAEMSPDVGEDGHRRVMLYRDGQTVRELVHRLVLTAFERRAADGEQGRHRDGDPSNNALANLSWGNQSANWDDRRRHGAFRAYAKISHEQAAEIRRRLEAGETGAALGREFGISGTQARNIGEGRQWSVEAPIQWPLPNCWKGVSAERQQEADARVPDLLATPAAVRFVSAEPLLGPIDFTNIKPADRYEVNALSGCDFDSGEVGQHIDWMIVGGESGTGARPMHPDWARSIREQCQSAGVAFFFKQWGGWIDHGPAWGTAAVDEHPVSADWLYIDSDGTCHSRRETAARCARAMERVGKSRAGRLLDGREWNEMPAPAAQRTKEPV